MYNFIVTDNDNDYIAIGSDEELVVALTSGMTQPFKLFVNITTDQPEHGKAILMKQT